MKYLSVGIATLALGAGLAAPAQAEVNDPCMSRAENAAVNEGMTRLEVAEIVGSGGVLASSSLSRVVKVYDPCWSVFDEVVYLYDRKWWEKDEPYRLVERHVYPLGFVG